jgi:hypothetical protein
MTRSESPRVLWFDDQLCGYQERLLKRQMRIFEAAGVEILKAPDLDTFARHLTDHWRAQDNTVDIQYLVLDLMVPQMHGVRDYSALGLRTTRVSVYTFGVQLLEILFGEPPPYPEHRQRWNGGLLDALCDIPTCVLSTNERGHASYGQYRLPPNRVIDFFWKDAPDDQLNSKLRRWLGRESAP